MKGLFESMKTAFKAFYHVHPVDACQCLSDVFRILVFAPVFGSQEFNGAVTGIVQSCTTGVSRRFSVGKLFQRFIETAAGRCTHLVFQFVGWQNIRKDNALRADVGPIVWVVQDIVSGTADGNLVYHSVTYLLVNLVYFSGHVPLVTFSHHLVVVLDEW